MIGNWRDAEDIAAAWVRRFGWADAEVTRDGQDNGIDVWAKGAVAQVKCWNQKKAGIEEVQRLAGSASPGQSCLFFSTHGYTRAALVWTYHPDHRMALFQLLLDGRLVACNSHAWRVMRQTPFRLPYAVRRPLLSKARKVYASLGTLMIPLSLYFLYVAAIGLMHGALATFLGRSFIFWTALLGLSCLGTAVHSLGPEAHRFVLAWRRYKATRSWADWCDAFKIEPDRDAGTPPDLFVGHDLHWLVRLHFFREDLDQWWRFTRRGLVSRYRGSA
jgi:Restriction endonuclease